MTSARRVQVPGNDVPLLDGPSGFFRTHSAGALSSASGPVSSRLEEAVARGELPPAQQANELRTLSLDWCQRLFGLGFKAVLLSTQRLLDLAAVLNLSHAKDWEDMYGRVGVGVWWCLSLAVPLTTLLHAVTMHRHRCALRRNRNYGWKFAVPFAVLQLSPLVEMVDKLGDGICWGLPETSSQQVQQSQDFAEAFRRTRSNPQTKVKGRRYGENLMRGLRKLSIVSIPTLFLSTALHLNRLAIRWMRKDGQRPGELDIRCDDFDCQSAVAGSVVAGLCAALACADLVLYMYVDDRFVGNNRKLVTLHYLVECLSRAPLVVLFCMTCVYQQNHVSMLLLWACDAAATVCLLLAPTLLAALRRGGARRRLTCKHFFCQFLLTLLLAQPLFFVNFMLFDPGEQFTVVNRGHSLVKYIEVYAMVKMIQRAQDDIQSAYEFEVLVEFQLAVTLANAALVWVLLPGRRRVAQARYLEEQGLGPLPGSNSGDMGWHFITSGDIARGPQPLTLRRVHSDVESPLDRSVDSTTPLSFNVEDMARKVRAWSAGQDCRTAVEWLGDILDALCLLSQTRSMKNSEALSRAMIVDVLWSLLLPWEGQYDAPARERPASDCEDAEWQDVSGHALLGAGGEIRALDVSRGAFLVRLKGGSELLATVLHGTMMELRLPGEGRFLGSFDGSTIRFVKDGSSDLVAVWHRSSAASGSIAATGNDEVSSGSVLRLILPQLVLALRWEPTHVGGAPVTGGGGAADEASAARTRRSYVSVDASQRPLVCFLVRYAMSSRDSMLVSEIYWLLWCHYHDETDPLRATYEKARWMLVSALQGRIEFWDHQRNLNLDALDDSAADLSFGAWSASGEPGMIFCRKALQLLVLQSAFWQQTSDVASSSMQVEGDKDEKTRHANDRLANWNKVDDVDPQTLDDPYLATSEPTFLLPPSAAQSTFTDRTSSLRDSATSVLIAEGGVRMPIDPAVVMCKFHLPGCQVLQSNASPLLLSCLVRTAVSDDEQKPSVEPAAAAASGERQERQSFRLRLLHSDATASVAESPLLSMSMSSTSLARSLIGGSVEMRRESPPPADVEGSFAESERAADAVSADGQPLRSADGALMRRKYMVKVGDDLRQDQLVLQMFSLMEWVWQEQLRPSEHQMLRLCPYRVFAMTPNAGYVKFVPGATSLSKAVEQGHGSLFQWLRSKRPPSVSLQDVLRNLCGSVAAYCVATYVLGIGDRHLDNLQITPEGHFFHIDFGFMFGSDPKPFAPQLRLPAAVATALDGVNMTTGREGDETVTMLEHCLQLAGRAYIALRRYMPRLWMPLLRLLGEAGGAGCQMTRPDAAMLFVRQRLRAELGDEEEEMAANEFLALLCENPEALYPMFTDRVHALALILK
eukprot:TRINITY_DN46288_c0_g1_i2.p1 TRINITY_DN46288_c0_g1~~TRINITY_DN46288_c0_g1_i2.p1  ORF type:complete len:1374 (-),score=305.68 TRINITY_DN46288_c0_g1_i2:384-4505(-)